MPPAGNKRRPEYRVWQGMRARCGNPRNSNFPHYGGRGITVCAAWDESFENFLADMGPRPSLAHSIDRIDNNGNYEPGNCRWATASEQARNTRRNRRLAVAGDLIPAVALYEQHGISRQLFEIRVRRGWSVERAASTPPRSWLHRAACAQEAA